MSGLDPRFLPKTAIQHRESIYMNEKLCRKCNSVKPISSFHVCKSNSDGKQAWCIDCRRIIVREGKRKRYSEDPEYREKALQKGKKGRIKYKEWIKNYLKEYGEQNKEKIQQSAKEYRIKNKEKIKIRSRNYMRERRRTDPHFRVKARLQCRIWHALKGKVKKSLRTQELLGCTIGEFRTYFELKFSSNMNWEKFDKGLIHIDHIIPCDFFDLTKEEEQRKCFHYTNLQPLWATTEISYRNNDKTIGNINKRNSLQCVIGLAANFEAPAIDQLTDYPLI